MRALFRTSAIVGVLGGCSSPSAEPGGETGEATTTTGGEESTSSTGVPEPEPDPDVGPIEPPERDVAMVDEPPGPQNMVLMESVVFYDGYAEAVDEPVPDGLVRHRNDLYAVRLTDEQLDVIQPNLQMQVLVGALCDNYDRIGNVFLALVEKGAESYEPGEVPRIEVARFITPFMNKNYQPDTVPYEWDIDNVAAVLRDIELRTRYDMWLELSVFGVPYAANTEVSGCEGRNDVFRGWLALFTDSTDEPAEFDELIPLATTEAFNNYQEGASDELGTTRKTVEITLDRDTDHAQLVLITSNHGANTGGEEYNRRDHYVYLDDELVLEYKPGRESCEPWREYNTQGNGIYGPTPRTDEEWQSFSNWCPGDVIDTRIIDWGPVDAGSHTFVIDVPDAIFTGAQGNFPFSLYLQAR